MRRIFITSLLGVLAFILIGCGGDEAQSANIDSENQNVESSAKNTDAANEDNTSEDNTEKIDPNEPPVYIGAATAMEEGNKFFDQNRNELAINAYKQATQLDPDLAEAHFKLGIAYALREHEEEMNPPPVIPTPTPEGKPTKKKKEEPKKKKSVLAFENAVIAYENLIKKDSKDAAAYYNLGRSYNKLNDDKEALKALEKASKLEPENSAYQTEYGAILMKFAKYDQAVNALNRALKIDADNTQAAELMVQAKAGKKRVDFGAEKLKEKNKE